MKQNPGGPGCPAYLNRAQLVASFGNSITEKPALWVAESQLAGAAPAANTAAADAENKAAEAAKKGGSGQKRKGRPGPEHWLV